MRSHERTLRATALACVTLVVIAGRPALAAPPARRAGPAPEEVMSTCATCHAKLEDPRLRASVGEHERGAHKDPRIGCVGCHEGDPGDPTTHAHEAKGFVARPSRAADCGACHSDAGFIRRINPRLPVGELALYELSLHGKLAASGDKAAPTCATCHGKHEILSEGAPTSPVSRANIASLCGGCHADPKHMAAYEIPTDQLAKWKKSVHGEAFQKGNPAAPTCTGCHGAHAATPPEAASAERTCGRCHEEERGLFDESAHARGFQRRGLAACVACHDDHEIAPASSLRVGATADATCTKCHAKDDKPLQVAAHLAKLLGRARDRAAEARAALGRAREDGLHISRAAHALDRVSTAEIRLRPVIHTLDPERVERAVLAVESAVSAAEALVTDAERARRAERRGYYVALALSILLFTTLMLKTRQLDRRRKQGAS